MRLRHKKPLNPYKGQTNNDKNEFNDDDFKQQGSPHKKAANGSTDQIYKYAKILSKFIKTINEDYINYELLNGRQPNSTLMQCEPEPEVERMEIGVGTEHVEKQIKDRKQITKLIARKQFREESRDHKAQTKKRQSLPSHANARENQNKNTEQSAPNPTTLPKNSILPKTPSQNTHKTEKEIKQSKTDPPSLNPNPLQSQLPTNTGFFGNPNPNNNFFNYVPPQTMNYVGSSNVIMPQQLITMQMLRTMNPHKLHQHMTMHFPPMNVMQQSYLPLNMNMNMMALMNMNLNNPQHRMMQTKPRGPVNLFKEQLVVYNKKSQTTESKNIRQTYPLKRSAYHVAIAYKIYLDKLKKQGNSFDQLEDIDPTRNARRIKNSQNQGNKAKDQKKKK